MKKQHPCWQMTDAGGNKFEVVAKAFGGSVGIRELCEDDSVEVRVAITDKTGFLEIGSPVNREKMLVEALRSIGREKLRANPAAPEWAKAIVNAPKRKLRAKSAIQPNVDDAENCPVE